MSPYKIRKYEDIWLHLLVRLPSTKLPHSSYTYIKINETVTHISQLIHFK